MPTKNFNTENVMYSMLKIINKDDLNQLQKDIYDLLQKISTDNHFISSIFLLIKQRETQEALFEFLKNNRGLNKVGIYFSHKQGHLEVGS